MPAAAQGSRQLGSWVAARSDTSGGRPPFKCEGLRAPPPAQFNCHAGPAGPGCAPAGRPAASRAKLARARRWGPPGADGAPLWAPIWSLKVLIEACGAHRSASATAAATSPLIRLPKLQFHLISPCSATQNFCCMPGECLHQISNSRQCGSIMARCQSHAAGHRFTERQGGGEAAQGTATVGNWQLLLYHRTEPAHRPAGTP